MDLTIPDRFGRLKALQRPSALPLVPQARPVLKQVGDEPDGVQPEVAQYGDCIAQALGAQVNRNEFGEYLAINRWFPEPSETNAHPAALRLLWPEAPEAIADPQQWLFLDTETTGLAGGTGTYAFLVGIAWWDAGGIRIEQFLMRDLDEEWPLLAALGERLQQRRVLVTFNGKSFDWPLLETRYRMTRRIASPEPRAHLDFMYPARNLWRLRLGSVRLAELERHVLEWNRGADLQSDLIPRIYLDFLRGGSHEMLVPIVRHNQMDLCGLAALSCRVLSLLADPETRSRDALELYGVSRIYERRGELQRARRLYECSLALPLPAEADRAVRTSLARLAKREKDYALASELWEKTLGHSRQGLDSYEQLAIYYEHHACDPQRALEITRQAMAEIRRAHRLGTIAAGAYRQAKGRFEHRLARLERKTSPALLHGFI